MKICIILRFLIVLNILARFECRQYEAKVFALLINEEELPYSYKIYLWALKIAEERVKELYPNLNITVQIKKSPIRCDSSAAPVYAAEEYYTRGLNALLGPSCTRGLEPVARMAAYWNIPICTPGGVDMRFRDKDVFKTLTRISFSLDQIGYVVLIVLKNFGWKHVALIVDETEELYSSFKDRLGNTLQDSDSNLEINTFGFTRSSTKKPSFPKILKKASKSARIFLLIGSGDVIRKILLEAHKLNMGSGEFAFLAIDFVPSREIFDNFSWKRPGDPENEVARKMYDSLLVLSVRQPAGPRYQQFIDVVTSRAFANITASSNFQFNLIVTGAYDCIITYAWALNKTLASKNIAPEDGFNLTRLIWNVSFVEGVIEEFSINANGDRLADFTLKDFDLTEMNTVATFNGLKQELIENPLTHIHWPSDDNQPPMDIPICGFTGENPVCKEKSSISSYYVILGSGFTILIAIALSISVQYYRKIKFESELLSLWWKVKWEDVTYEERIPRSFGNLCKNDELDRIEEPFGTTACGPRLQLSMEELSSTTNPGVYRGMKVAIKRVNIKKLTVTTGMLVEMRHMRDINHENLIRFIGLCTEENKILILSEYSSRGCLRDLLQNDEITIDWPFRFSLIADIIEGMSFLHSSPISYHGHLKSTNCVIDGRFVVKITDFGMREINKEANQNLSSSADFDISTLFWTAPEHLREDANNKSNGSSKGDVYSFAIILQEIITRSAPFESFKHATRHRDPLANEEIIERIIVESVPPFRPEIPPDECPIDLLDLVHLCWHENPAQRPSFHAIRALLKRSNLAYEGDNFLDNLLSRMEQYTNNLEQLADQRTNAFLEEKQKTEELLYEVLPKSVAEQLKSGCLVQPENFDCVTICFSDIVGFTRLAAQTNPMNVVNMLNDLYTCFDSTIAAFDVYKVETIGDAYMVVSGCPIPNGNNHAREIAKMSLALLKAINEFQVSHKPDQKIQLRIGVHSGSCAAGVVGLKMPRYCLFGISVNIALRMEATGEAMKIHVSEDTKEILEQFGAFNLQCRGEIELKDLGISKRTYWIINEINQEDRSD